MQKHRQKQSVCIVRFVKITSKFRDIAKGESESPYKRRGGDVGFVPKTGKPGLDQELVDMAFEMNVETLSKPFKTTSGWNVIYVPAKREAKDRSFSQMKGSVLRKIKMNVSKKCTIHTRMVCVKGSMFRSMMLKLQSVEIKSSGPSKLTMPNAVGNGAMSLLTLLLGSYLQAATLDRVAAVVNDDLIVLSSVYEVGAEFLTAQIGTDNLREAELEVLNTLIQRTLVSQELQGLGMDVTEEEVEGAMNDIAESNGIARSELRSEVEASGLEWDAYIGEIRESLQTNEVQPVDIAASIVVDEQAIQEQYRQVKLQQPDVIELYGLLLKNPPPAARPVKKWLKPWALPLRRLKVRLMPWEQAMADSNATLEQITALLAGGADFNQLAQQYDQSGLAQIGGKMGTFAKGQLRKEFDEIAFSLPVGGVSEPLSLRMECIYCT